MIIGEDDRFVALVDALLLVAADPNEQLERLPVFRAIAEQILSGGQGVVLLDEQLAREGILPEKVRAIVQQIDETFDRLLEKNQPDLWTEAALRENEIWGRLRRLSRQALQVLGIERTRLRLPNPGAC